MRINKEKVKQVDVQVRDTGLIELINVQTGEVETAIVTSRRYILTYKEHRITIGTSSSYDDLASKRTVVGTDIQLNLKEIKVYDLAVLFTAYTEKMNEVKNDFDSINYISLQRQSQERWEIYRAVLKEEKKYERQLLNAELKRLAKENVDKRKPPIVSIIPTSSMLIAIETSEEK
jgi:hypothetical protein